MLRVLLALIIFIACSETPLQASHYMGGHIEWEWQKNDTLLINVYSFRDCRGEYLMSSGLQVKGLCGGKDTILYSGKVQIKTVRGFNCISACSPCTSTCNNIGAQEYLFSYKLYAGKYKCCDLALTYIGDVRNSSITTGAADQRMVLKAKLSTCADKRTNSPHFENPDYGIFTVDQCVEINFGKNIYPGFKDSLVYKLTPPLQDTNKSVSISSPYSYVSPIDYNGIGTGTKTWDRPKYCYGFSLDNQYGILHFKPKSQEVGQMAILIETWRKDTAGIYRKISELTRDIQLIVRASNANYPVVTDHKKNYYFVAGTNNCLSIQGYDMDSAKIEWNNYDSLQTSLAADTFFTDYFKGEWCWTPGKSYVSSKPYYIFPRIYNAACPIPGIDYREYKIFVVDTPEVAPNFLVNPSSKQCYFLNTFTFKNTTKDSLSFLTYLWDFGDGDTSTKISPVKSFRNIGKYKVTLYTFFKNKLLDSAVQEVQTLQTPKVLFEMSADTVCSGTHVQFSDSTTYAGNDSLIYKWDFGDGTYSNVRNPNHLYTSNLFKVYDVKLEISTPEGCVQSLAKKIRVLPKPAPAFTINALTKCRYQGTFVFTNTTPADPLNLFFWDFGDGTSSTLKNPSHIYKKTGTYRVKLLVKKQSVDSCTDSAIRTVVVTGPVPSFTVSNTAMCLTGNKFIFTDNSKADSNGTLAYNWSFGDGVTASTKTVTHIYAKAGKFKVLLTVTSSTGCRDTFTRFVWVTLPQNKTSFTVNSKQQCFKGNSFIFTNTTNSGSASAAYLWRFGDGDSALSKDAAHIYKNPGNYIVRLYSIDSNSCPDSAIITVTVYASPQGNITGPATAYTGDTVLYRYNNVENSTLQWLATGGIIIGANTEDSVSINWGNGQSGTVMLVVSSINNCVDTFAKTVALGTNGLKENPFLPGFNLFPNPTSGKLYLQCNREQPVEITVQLFDALGQNHFFANLYMEAHSTKEFDFTGLPKGFYFIKIEAAGHFSMHKIIIH